MSTPLVVIRKNALDHALSFDEQAAGSLFEGATDYCVAIRTRPALCALWQRRATEQASREYHYEQRSHVACEPSKYRSIAQLEKHAWRVVIAIYVFAELSNARGETNASGVVR
jgi:hypothetical protein